MCRAARLIQKVFRRYKYNGTVGATGILTSSPGASNIQHDRRATLRASALAELNNNKLFPQNRVTADNSFIGYLSRHDVDQAVLLVQRNYRLQPSHAHSCHQLIPRGKIVGLKGGTVALFLGVGKKCSTTNAIVPFSPDLSMKISNFSKTVHTIFMKFCTVLLHCAMASKSFDWDSSASKVKRPNLTPFTAHAALVFHSFLAKAIQT